MRGGGPAISFAASLRHIIHLLLPVQARIGYGRPGTELSWVRLSPLLLPGVPEAWLLPAQPTGKTHSLISPCELSKGPFFLFRGPGEYSCLPTRGFSEMLGSAKVSGL